MGCWRWSADAQSNALKLTPMAGIELELLPFSSWQYQTRFGLRGGFAFSTGDHFLAEACNGDEALLARPRGATWRWSCISC